MLRLSPAGPPPPSRRPWWVGASVALHVAALAALLLLVPRREQRGTPPPSYELVFEQPQGAGPVPAPESPAPVPDPEPPAPAAPPAPVAPPAPEAPPTPMPMAPPAPDPMAPTAPADDALPGPVSPAPTAPPQPETPPVPAPAPDAEPTPETIPPRPAAPEVRIEVPPGPEPLLQPVPELVLPTPPAPVAAPPAPPPRPATPPQRPRTAPPPAPSLGTLSRPMDLDFGAGRTAAPRATAAPGSVASRSIELSPGRVRTTPNRQEAFFDARAQRLGADWMEGVRGFWLRHRYYPRQAVENGEDGTADIELVVGRSGKVQSVRIVSRSGSSFLDMAAVGTFRDAQLPPVPFEVEAPYTVTLSINYILLR